MGVLGWTEDQTLDASMPAIVAALKGRNRLITNVLQAIFGGEKAAPKQALTPQLFRSMFG